MSDGFRTIHRDDVLHCLVWDRVFVQRWIAGTPDAVPIEKMLEVHVAFVGEHPPGTTFMLSHVEHSALRTPDARMRAAMERHTQLVEWKLRAATTVITASGFGAAMARGILSSLLTVTRPSCPHRVFSSTRDGFAFLARYGRDDGWTASADEIEARYRLGG